MTENRSKEFTFFDICDDYNEFIDECSDLNFFTRSKRLQKEILPKIDEYIVKIKQYKNQAIKHNVEREANLLFHFQCMLRALQSSLSVWIEIKDENYLDAWRYLVDAQEYKDIALKIEDHVGVRNLEDRLKKMEGTLFPPWGLYNSAGFSESIGDCSICTTAFGKCDHIENVIYLGRICRRVNRKFIKANHTAMVKNPRDRRCIITKISDDNGKMIDNFTLEISGDKNTVTDATLMEGIILTTVVLDLD